MNRFAQAFMTPLPILTRRKLPGHRQRRAHASNPESISLAYPRNTGSDKSIATPRTAEATVNRARRSQNGTNERRSNRSGRNNGRHADSTSSTAIVRTAPSASMPLRPSATPAQTTAYAPALTCPGRRPSYCTMAGLPCSKEQPPLRAFACLQGGRDNERTVAIV